jgi:Ca2+-binding RTX toxin-like protein
VGDLSATDADGDTLSYTLTDNAGGKFALVTEEGVTKLVVNGALNFETASSYNVRVGVSDGQGGLSSDTFAISVTDVDEAPAGLKISSPIVPSVTAIGVPENAPAGTVVGNLAATDPEGGAITYTLTDDAGGLFVLDGNQIKLAQDLGDFETAAAKTYQIAVTAEDAGGNATLATFNIRHADAYDAPEGVLTIDATGTTAGVDFGTFITNYFAGLTNGAFTFYGGTPVTAFGQPQNVSGEQIAFRYKEGGVDQADRVVLGGDGELAYDYFVSGSSFGHGISGKLDSLTFGQWVDGVTQGTAGIGDAGQLTGLLEQLKITGFDLESVPGTGHVPSVNLVYALYSATQTGDAAAIYSALSNYAQSFKGSEGNDSYTGSGYNDTIDGGAGNDTLDGGGGTDTAVFDGNFGFGPGSDYTFAPGQGGVITLTDMRAAGGTGTDVLSNIEVLKFNNLTYSLVTHQANYTPTDVALDDALINADAAAGTAVGALTVTDQDAGDSHTLELIDDAGGLFALNGTSLEVAGALTAGDHTVTVRATDSIGNVFEKEITVTVEAPVVPEPAGTITIDASASGTGMDLEAFIRGGFVADAASGGFPVFDNGSNFSGEEMVIGYGSNATSKYVLAKGDVSYGFSTHTVFGEIGTIEYGTLGAGTYDANGALTGTDVQLRITGLQFANPLPANGTEEAEIEANGAVHNFTVAHMAGSNASPARLDLYADQLGAYAQSFKGSAFADVYTGTQFNDTIDGGGGNDALDGGAGTDTAVFDGNFAFGPGSDYTFAPGAGGSITLTDIRAAGGTGTDTLSNIEILKFNNLTYSLVTHQANYTPTDLALDDATVDGDAPDGTQVGLLVVTDQNAGDTHTFTLLDDAGGKFVLDGSALEVAGTLTEEEYTVRVRVTDSAGNTFETDLTIDVDAPAQNSAPTGLALSPAAVAEDAANGAQIGDLSATDTDGDTLSYELIDDANGKFTLATSGGVTRLVVAAALDYELAASHSVTVKVSDGKGGEATETFTVTVTDANEAPVITSGGGGATASINVRENNTAVALLAAADPEAAALTWSIAGGADAAKFTIDAATGALSFKAASDFEAPSDSGRNNGYDVFVRASDGVLDDMQMLRVSVTNAGGKSINGTTAGDRLEGSPEGDTIDGKAGADTMLGGTGNDAYIVDSTDDRAIEREGEGTDLVKASVSHTLSANVENLTLTGANAINGSGNASDNIITGNASNNVLSGHSGNDVLRGGIGNDTVYGGAGADDLCGGRGNDIFMFKSAGDSTLHPSGRDTIFDFRASEGDRIMLSHIDANTAVGGNQMFSFIATAAFSQTAGELRYAKLASDTFVYGDVDGDARADFVIHLDNALNLKNIDFLL